ncbi:AAA family ATPase [Kistimonas asteriae]|uniref:AAA family ATPase n=1 Tax=Kistimonas asteriae TaxID=517724 RepID=UPI001BA8BF59
MLDQKKAAMTNADDWLDDAIPESEMARREQMAVNPKSNDAHDNKQGNKTTKEWGGYFEYSNLAVGFDTRVDWIIKGYLPANTLGVVYGASESFKSFHVLSWAASIATGRQWNGVKCKYSPVLYVAAEGGIGASRRAKGWQITYNNDHEVDNLFAVKAPVFIGSPNQVQALINTVNEIEKETGEKISTIIIDTLARCFGGADENKAADMNLFVAGCDKVRVETGATILVVHHTGKSAENGARGSSALRAACDFEYSIDRPEKGMLYVLKCTKVKDSEPPKAEAFQMNIRHLYTDEDGDDVTTLVASTEGQEPPEGSEAEAAKPLKLTGNQEAIIQAIRSRNASGEPTTRQVILDDFKAQGGNAKHFGRIINQLISKDIIVQDGDDLMFA